MMRYLRPALVLLALYGILLALTAQVLIPGGTIPAGGIIAIDSGGCPSGWTELVAAQGRFLAGTPSGGTIGGTVATALTDLENRTLTPSGTISWPAGVPSFSGDTLSTHAHETVLGVRFSFNDVLLFSSYGQGPSKTYSESYAYTDTGSSSTNANDLTQTVSAGTPSGTISWPAGVPPFSGSSGALNVPYLQVRLCKKS